MSKDLRDACYLLGEPPQVTLFAVSIAPLQEMRVGLSSSLEVRLPGITALVRAEIRSQVAGAAP